MEICSYEIAKKLKEKGFSLNTEDVEFIGCRFIFSDECTIKRISTIGAYDKGYFGENINCPTISQVLKWLRKEKKIHICVDFDGDMNWYYQIAIYGSTDIAADGYGYNDYEISALAGIERVLDNFI